MARTDGTHLTDYVGIEVFVSKHGDFYAEVGEVMLTQPTLEGLKAAIEAELKQAAKLTKISLACWAMVNTGTADQTGWGVQEVEVVGLNRNDSTFKFKDGLEGKLNFLLPNTEENFKLLTEYVQATNSVSRLWQILKPRSLGGSGYGGRIRASEYEARLSGIKTQYQHSLSRNLSEEELGQKRGGR